MTDGNSKKPDDAGPDDADAENPAFVWTPYEGAEDSLMPEDPESLSYRDGLQQGSADEAREEERRAKDRDDKNVFALGGALSQEKMLKMQNLAEAGNFKIAGFGGYGADKKALEEKQRMNDYFRRMVGGYMTPQQWDSQMTSIGGRRMTNAEALKVFNKVLENPDRYKKVAAEKGIGEDEWQRIRRLMERRKELMELQRESGGLTEDQDRELKTLESDPLMKKFEKIVPEVQADDDRLPGKVAHDKGNFNSRTRNEADGTQSNDVQQQGAAALASLKESAGGGKAIGGAFHAAVYAEAGSAGQTPRNETADASKTVVSFRAAADPPPGAAATPPDVAPDDGKAPQTEKNIGSGLGV
ncbi:MAG: hypothetical protein HY370_01235 [Proteobacteria bacterium]|nr:hypothetical protein [Pseudomonadota bacterium]